jgi:signal transduction histidine kinase
MKKKIVIGLSVFALIFILGGVYIVVTIEKGTSTLDNLIMLHQVEILREHLLLQIRRVQSDLHLKNTRYARDVQTIVEHVENMGVIADTCFECHHTGEVSEKLTDLRHHIGDYKAAISRVLTIRANAQRHQEEEDRAFRIGEGLLTRVNNMIALTNMRLNRKTQSSLAEISHTKNMLYMLVITLPLFAVVLAFVFIRGITKPADVLLEATRKLKGGDLDFRIEGLKDEFGEVAASFNKMASALKRHMLETQRAEQMKMVGVMAAGLAHEIKNPLAGIKVSMEVLSEGSSLCEEDRSVILGVIEEIRRIETLMKSLLNFAKPPKPRFMTAYVNNILDTTINFSLKYQSSAAGGVNGLHIRKEFDADLPPTVADPMQLQQVFLNLLLNASAAMSDGGGVVTVSTFHDKTEDCIAVTISDTGKGISEEVMDKIFHPFFTTKSKGTGLGLAISKQLVEQHGGAISVSNNPGGGATFKICLPVRQGVAEEVP